MTEEDVVTLLLDQHERIRVLFTEVEQASGEQQQEAFERLRRFLAVHETAEEMVVHPRARWAEGGDDVVEARLHEERAAKEVLSMLDGMSVDDAGFHDMVDRLREAVLAHAESEEREEFPLLRQETDPRTLKQMADAVRAAEAMAPTHPHPGVESLPANLLAGPVAALVDRTRDVLRAALGRAH